jgi:hypothetical protein
MSNGSAGDDGFTGRAKRAEKLVEHLLEEMDSYHNHKENMVHAGILVMLLLCGGVFSTNQLPKWILPTWLQMCSQEATFVGFLVIWWLLHIYIRWQLRRRRAAALTYNGTLSALSEWIKRNPKEEDLKFQCSNEKGEKRLTRKLKLVLDHLFPVPSAPLDFCMEKNCIPKWLNDALHQQKKGPVYVEWLVTVGSFIAILLVYFRIFWSAN